MIDKELSKEIVKRLVEAYSPLDIYLFGSHIWGTPNIDSDVDLLIILDNSEEKLHKRPIKGLKALKGLDIPKDLIVLTKNEFEKTSSEKSSLYHRIKTEGKILYEQSI